MVVAPGGFISSPKNRQHVHAQRLFHWIRVSGRKTPASLGSDLPTRLSTPRAYKTTGQKATKLTTHQSPTSSTAYNDARKPYAQRPHRSFACIPRQKQSNSCPSRHRRPRANHRARWRRDREAPGACVTHGFFYLDLQTSKQGRQILADEQGLLRFMREYFDQPHEVKMLDDRQSFAHG